MQVLISPPSEAARKSLECLVAWSRAGLLDPFCWWETSETTVDRDLRVSTVTRGRQESKLLADALRDSRPDEIDLVAFVPVDSSSPIQASFSEQVREKVNVAREVLPHQADKRVEGSIVVAPAEIGMPLPEGLFLPEWSANVYVAPEDRDDPEGVNALASNEARLPPHASHAIATITEMWRSAGRNGHSVLDTLKGRQLNVAPAPIQVVRCFTRGIDIGYLADHVAESVFLPGSAWPNPDPTKFDRVQDAEMLVDRAAKAFLGRHREILGPTTFEPYVLPADEEIGLWEAMKRMFRILIDRIKSQSYKSIVARAHGAHDWMAEKIEKLDAGATGIKIRRLGERVREGDDAVDLDDALEMPIYRGGTRVGRAWSDLRGLAFCLVDGRAWPEGLGENLATRGNKRALVTDPLLIVPNPMNGYSLVRGDRSRPACDPMNEDPSLQPREKQVATTGKSHAGATRASASPDGEAAERTKDADREDESAEPKGDLIPEALVRDGSEPSDTDDDHARARSSLLWKVGLHIAKAQRSTKAEAASLRAQDETENESQSEEEREAEEALADEVGARSRNRIRGFIKAMLVSLFVVVIAAVLAFELPLVARIPVLVALPFAWLLALAYQARKIMIEERKEANELAQKQVDEYNRRLLASIREGDAKRIADHYEEFKDWAEIIGWFVHSPWIGEPLEQIEVDAPVPQGSRPLAFQMATGVSDFDWLADLGRTTQEEVFKPGWLNDLYSDNASEVLGQSVGPPARGRGSSAGRREDPATDSLDDVDSPRRRLLRGVRRGDYRHIGDNAMTKDLLGHLDAEYLDAAASRVDEAGHEGVESEALPLSPSWFSAPSNLENLMRRLSPSVLRVKAVDGEIESVGTGALLPDQETAVTALHVVEGSESVSVTLPDGSEIEGTLDQVVPEYDLAILRFPERLDLEPIDFAANEVPAGGEPIVTLGYHGGDEGEPTFSWGFITDAGRTVDLEGLGGGVQMIEANYQSAVGSSGAPLFDLSGGMVGLHVGSRRVTNQDSRMSFLSHAIPAQLLIELLADGGSGRPDQGWTPPQSGLSAAVSGGRRRRPQGVKPSEFFSELLDGQVGGSDSGMNQAFLPRHWTTHSGALPNEVDTVIAEPVVQDVSISVISDYCDGNAFFRPLRLMVHRTDIAKLTTQDNLASIANGRGGSPAN